MTSTAIINQRDKSHQAKNLLSWPYSYELAATTATYHIALMYQNGGREEVTNLVCRLPRRRLGSRPTWLVGACLLADLPSKNTLTTTQLRLSTRRDQNGRQRPPWCPTPGTGAYYISSTPLKIHNAMTILLLHCKLQEATVRLTSTGNPVAGNW
jgi:hypothetical protein